MTPPDDAQTSAGGGPTREELAWDVLSLAHTAGMPDTYWATDQRIGRACAVLELSPAQARTRAAARP